MGCSAQSLQQRPREQSSQEQSSEGGKGQGRGVEQTWSSVTEDRNTRTLMTWRNSERFPLTCPDLSKEEKSHEMRESERVEAGIFRGSISKGCVNSKHSTHHSPCVIYKVYVLLIFKSPSSCHNSWHIVGTKKKSFLTLK